MYVKLCVIVLIRETVSAVNALMCVYVYTAAAAAAATTTTSTTGRIIKREPFVYTRARRAVQKKQNISFSLGPHK